MSDADGDSTMHSSPRSSVSDDLFPGADADGSSNAAAAASSGGGGVPLPSTPAANIVKTAELSPPNSQGAPGLPPLAGSSSSTASAADATTINANGKRVYPTANTGAALEAKGKAAAADMLNNNSSGAGVGSSTTAMDTNTSSLLDGGVSIAGISPDANASSKPVVPSVHAASGYRWEREADSPGWAWKNKKAQEDWYKAEETFVDRDRMVKASYGDPLEGGGIAAATATTAGDLQV